MNPDSSDEPVASQPQQRRKRKREPEVLEFGFVQEIEVSPPQVVDSSADLPSDRSADDDDSLQLNQPPPHSPPPCDDATWGPPLRGLELSPPATPSPLGDSFPTQPTEVTAATPHRQLSTENFQATSRHDLSSTPPPQKEPPMSSNTPPSSRPVSPAPPAATHRPPLSGVDFRRNVEQQRKEQKTFGSLVSTVTYLMLTGLVLVTLLAGLGGFHIWQRLNDQAGSLGQLEAQVNVQVGEVWTELKRARADLDRLNKELEIISGQASRQQEQISVLRASLDKTLAELRAERANRQRELATLQRRYEILQQRLDERR